jgi:hypothetical protein
MKRQAICYPIPATKSSAARHVFLALARYVNSDGMCWPPLQTLSHDTALSEAVVRRAIKTLCEAKAIRLEDVNGAARYELFRQSLSARSLEAMVQNHLTIAMQPLASPLDDGLALRRGSKSDDRQALEARPSRTQSRLRKQVLRSDVAAHSLA